MPCGRDAPRSLDYEYRPHAVLCQPKHFEAKPSIIRQLKGFLTLPPPYSPELLASIQRTITKERLTRYLGATGQDTPKALALYEFNVQLSEVLYGLLHGLEIMVRNATHDALTRSYGTAAWYDAAPLSSYWQDQLAKAKAKPGAAGKPGKVISELTFGFWVDLLQATNHRRLWVNQKLHRAFPHAAGKTRFDIHERLKAIHLLRNRLSHHEPILTSANGVYNGNIVIPLPQLTECMEWVCLHTARWIKAEFRYGEAERILREVTAMSITL